MNEINDLPKLVNAGEIIYLDNKLTSKLYLIKKGEVRLIKIINNHLHVIQVCTVGDIINDVSVLLNKPTDHVAVAYNWVEIVEVDAKDIRSVISKCPKWVPEIFRTLCDRLMDSQEIIHEHNMRSGAFDSKYILSKSEEKDLLEKIASLRS